jgi:hypothetical protein
MELIACELYNKNIHGYTELSDPIIKSSFIVLYRENDNESIDDNYYESDEEENVASTNATTISKISSIQQYCHDYYRHFRQLSNKCHTHDTVKNYFNIIKNKNYIKPELAICLTLKGGETVAILKTFWLRIFQRKCRSRLMKHREIIKRKCVLNNLRYREMYGYWPQSCKYI